MSNQLTINVMVLRAVRAVPMRNGKLHASDVVTAAKLRSSPMHPYIWRENEKEAAHQRRLYLARKLIQVTAMLLPTENDAPLVVRAFYSLTIDRNVPGGGYRGMRDIMLDEALREQLLADAVTQLRAFQNKYRMLTELAEVFAAIDKVAAGSTM